MKDIVKGINLMKNMGIKYNSDSLIDEFKKYKPYSQDRKPLFVDDYYGLVDCVCCGKRKHKSNFRYRQVGYRRNECKDCMNNYKHDHRADSMAYCFASMDKPKSRPVPQWMRELEKVNKEWDEENE